MSYVSVLVMAVVMSSLANPDEVRILLQFMKREPRETRTAAAAKLSVGCATFRNVDEATSDVSDIHVGIIDNNCFDQMKQLSMSEPTVKGIFRDGVVRHLEQWSGAERKEFQHRSSMHFSGTDATKTLQIEETFWKRNARGGGVKVAIFDTGIVKKHAHFKRATIKTCVDYTNTKPSCEDGFGHGSYVAGIIAATDSKCKGMAPDAELHIFKVFTDKQESFTSWFLEAFNHAMDLDVDVLNLSIGGPDYLDQPFTDKVREVSASGITIISAIGNDGPLYGTLNNPGDQIDVIGVGAVSQSYKVATFSSRGMTTWELPQGYGRMKPDLLSLGESVYSTQHDGDCKVLSGTSVASPVVAGAVTALVSLAKTLTPPVACNPALLKQLITHTAVPLRSSSMYEQGSGVMSARKAADYLLKYEVHASIHPPRLNLSDCSYAWPHCKMPIYFTGQPVVLNLTILNPRSVSSRIERTTWTTTMASQQDLLNIEVEPCDVVWPWSGWIGVSVTSTKDISKNVLVEGVLRCFLTDSLDTPAEVELVIPVIATPPKSKRLLWDVYHNIQYPPFYIARDDLSVMGDALDWNGDHPHTNFRDAYNFLINNGYYVELLSSDSTTFDGSLYGALLLIDVEDEFTEAEVQKLTDDVSRHNLGLIVFADWYNSGIMKKSSFRDDNTREVWHPLVGGCNIPSLNRLLAPFGIAFGNAVYHGHLTSLSSKQTGILFGSGSAIAQFPAGGTVIRSTDPLTDVEKVFAAPAKSRSKLFTHSAHGVHGVPIMGFYKKVAVYGDTSCLDTSHNMLGRFCFNFLKAMLDFVVNENYQVASDFVGHELLQKPFLDAKNEVVAGVGLTQRNVSHSLDGVADRRGHDHLLKPVQGNVVRPVKAVTQSPYRWRWDHNMAPGEFIARDPIVIVTPLRHFDYRKMQILLPMGLSLFIALLMLFKAVRMYIKKKPIFGEGRRRRLP